MAGSSPCAQLPLLVATGNPKTTCQVPSRPCGAQVTSWQDAAAAACTTLHLAAYTSRGCHLGWQAICVRHCHLSPCMAELQQQGSCPWCIRADAQAA